MANTSIPAGSYTGTVALAPPETITARPSSSPTETPSSPYFRPSRATRA